uniref:uncharacterized protein LOC100185795 isoform X4 n=1 Tax=Ciona intestinalis TaxID=7719 RepID=UPI00006A4C40|nr:uncharacterized protein LOC100185795 isoform X4 [Ciona intestinalis]|eukprot:XP_004225861.1 uncharacterized protein LOC100185795 isoform X4 [Ciona intestinalis]
MGHPVLFLRSRSNGRYCDTRMVNGYITLCCVSALIALLSILLLHSLTSIWLDPLRNLRLNEEFVYITVAMATSSAALNLCAISTYCVQIYLVYTDRVYSDTRKLQYLREVSGVRFVATICVFISIPVFIASFGCYLYMELHWLAGIIAVSILGLAVTFIIISMSCSYYKWDRMHKTVTRYQPYSYIEANNNTNPWVDRDHALEHIHLRKRENTNEALLSFRHRRDRRVAVADCNPCDGKVSTSKKCIENTVVENCEIEKEKTSKKTHAERRRKKDVADKNKTEDNGSLATKQKQQIDASTLV